MNWLVALEPRRRRLFEDSLSIWYVHRKARCKIYCERCTVLRHRKERPYHAGEDNYNPLRMACERERGGRSEIKLRVLLRKGL